MMSFLPHTPDFNTIRPADSRSRRLIPIRKMGRGVHMLTCSLTPPLTCAKVTASWPLNTPKFERDRLSRRWGVIEDKPFLIRPHSARATWRDRHRNAPFRCWSHAGFMGWWHWTKKTACQSDVLFQSYLPPKMVTTAGLPPVILSFLR